MILSSSGTLGPFCKGCCKALLKSMVLNCTGSCRTSFEFMGSYRPATAPKPSTPRNKATGFAAGDLEARRPPRPSTIFTQHRLENRSQQCRWMLKRQEVGIICQTALATTPKKTKIMKAFKPYTTQCHTSAVLHTPQQGTSL